MKLLIVTVLLLTGCDRYSEVQQNIDEFSSECKRLARCMNLPYKVSVDLNSRSKMKCTLEFSKLTESYLYFNSNFNIETAPTFGYNSFGNAIRVCRMLKKKGSYSDRAQNAEHRYNKCVELKPNDRSHKKACFKQYRNGKFYE